MKHKKIMLGFASMLILMIPKHISAQTYKMLAEAVCTKQEDEIDNDDIYIYIEHKDGTTSSSNVVPISEGEKRVVTKDMLVKKGDNVYLYEKDVLDPDDLLLSFTVNEDFTDGKYHTVAKTGIRYDYTLFVTLTSVEINYDTDTEK